jgi:hypothetical protein
MPKKICRNKKVINSENSSNQQTQCRNGLLKARLSYSRLVLSCYWEPFVTAAFLRISSDA